MGSLWLDAVDESESSKSSLKASVVESWDWLVAGEVAAGVESGIGGGIGGNNVGGRGGSCSVLSDFAWSFDSLFSGVFGWLSYCCWSVVSICGVVLVAGGGVLATVVCRLQLFVVSLLDCIG